MKPFRAILSEQDVDYKYQLCSIENIHGQDMIDKITIALRRYGLISMVPKGIQTKLATSEDSVFTNHPFSLVFVSDIVMANPLSSSAVVQSIAVFTRIKADHLQLLDDKGEPVNDGADTEQHAHPIEIDSKQAQEEVGTARVQSLISDTMKGLVAQRKQQRQPREVYEGVVASHKEVQQMIGAHVRRGFYLVETVGAGMGTIAGPFGSCPDNYPYITTIPATKLTISKPLSNGLVEHTIEYLDGEKQNDPEDAGTRPEGTPMEIVLANKDTGKEHMIVVRSENDTSAKIKALEIIAQQTGIAKDRFTVLAMA